jgi:hypothetical protein
VGLTVSAPPVTRRGPSRHLRKLPLVLAGILVAIVLLVLVASMFSMWQTLKEESGSDRYNLLTAAPVQASAVTLADEDAVYLAVTATNLDEDTQVVDLRVSGHRTCSDCPETTVQFFALDANPGDWWGLPPSASLDLPAQTRPFTATVSLPVTGMPQRYPLDSYQLLLGLAVQQRDERGALQVMTREQLERSDIVGAVNEQLPRYRMVPPVVTALPPEAARRGLVSALDLTFSRPLFLPMVAGMLVALIFISSLLSTVLQETGEVFVGLGSLVLGVWGISSIVVQTAYRGLTLVDVSLAAVIMIALVGVVIRGALVIARRPSRE